MWIMAYALSDKMTRKLQSYCNRNPKDVVSQINWQIFFLKNNGEVLTNMVLLKKEDPDFFEFFAIEPLSEFIMPEKIKNVVEFLVKNNSTNIQNAIEEISNLKNLEELRNIRINYEYREV
jgi:hypothetical protein